MAEAVELRRVPCVRDFPNGCGPDAVTLDRKPEAALPPPPGPPLRPPSPLPAESGEPAACDTVAEPSTGVGAELPSAESDGKSLVAIGYRETVDFAAPVGCLEPQREADQGKPGSSSQDDRLGPPQGKSGSSDQDEKLRPSQLLNDGLEQPKVSYVSGTDRSSRADRSLKRPCSPKMYPPPVRRAVSAVRNFPIGCGPSAPLMNREQALKLVAVASSNDKSPIDDKKPKEDQPPASIEYFDDVRVSTDNEIAKGMERRIELKRVEEETINAKVSTYYKIDKRVRERIEVMSIEEDTVNDKVSADSAIDKGMKERIEIKSIEETNKVSSDDEIAKGMKERIEIKSIEETNKVSSDDEIAKGMKEQIEVKSIEEETINAKVSTDHDSSEVENKQLVVEESIFKENRDTIATVSNSFKEAIEPLRNNLEPQTSKTRRDNKILAISSTDKRLDEKAIVLLSDNLEAQTSKTTRGNKLHSLALTDKRLNERAIEPLSNNLEVQTSKTLIDNRTLATAMTIERLDEQAIEPLSNNLEARTSKNPASQNLANKRLSSGKSTDKLVKNEKVHEIIKRKFTDVTADEDSTQIDQKLDADNLEAYGDRLIVQALMAPPNCPWRQGRKLDTPGAHSVLTLRSKMRRAGAASAMQLELPKSDGEGTTSANKLALQKLKRESTTSDMQLVLAKQKGDDSTSDHQFTLEEEYEDFTSNHERNEQAFTIHEGSGEPCDAALPLSVYQGSQSLSIVVPPNGPSGWDYSGSSRQDLVDRLKVRRVLRLFQVICRKLLQSEEAKVKLSGNIKRVDLTAAQMLKNKGEWVNVNMQTIGSVPGVEVGDEFQYRVELSIVGLHRPFQGGIDSVTKNGTKVAASIVASGGYNDDMDSSDVLIYSGSGGNPSGPNKPPEDQKLERGNLALKNSIDTKTPVRVIHGIKEMKGGNSYDTKPKLVSTFTYAGLYLVEKYWQEQGPHGFNVFKFQLRRIPGQPELALQEVKRTKKLKIREGLCMKDISDGKEKIPICVINTINDERPPPFKYITNIKYPSQYTKAPPRGCDCTKGCSESGNCACVVKNLGEIPFNFNGAIVQAKPLVFECGPSCKCPPTCHNRVSQRGIQIPLEIFRTKNMGWGVRSLYSIPSGSFICEYVGELLEDKEAEKRSNDEYLFDIGHNYDDYSLWEGLPSLMPDLETGSQCDTVDDMGFTIDAAEYGNVGRFINHSCSPNLYAQNVLYDHDDRRTPHIMFFAAENIPPLQELTYHYNYSIGQVSDAEGNVKRKDCFCGSPECSGRLY